MERDEYTLIKPKQAAMLLGVSQGTLQVWRCTGSEELRYVKVGRSVMYRLVDIQAYINSNIRGGHNE